MFCMRQRTAVSGGRGGAKASRAGCQETRRKKALRLKTSRGSRSILVPAPAAARAGPPVRSGPAFSPGVEAVCCVATARASPR